MDANYGCRLTGEQTYAVDRNLSTRLYTQRVSAAELSIREWFACVRATVQRTHRGDDFVAELKRLRPKDEALGDLIADLYSAVPE